MSLLLLKLEEGGRKEEKYKNRLTYFFGDASALLLRFQYIFEVKGNRVTVTERTLFPKIILKTCATNLLTTKPLV